MLPHTLPHPRTLPLLALSLALGACSSTGERPAAPRIQTEFAFTADAPLRVTGKPWWDEALQPALRADVAQLLDANPAIRIAAAQVAADSARLDAAEAERWTDVTASARGAGQVNDGSGTGTLSAGIDARLPLDLFGRLRLSRDAAAFDLAQSLAQLEQTRLQQVQAYLISRIDAAEASALLRLLREQVQTTRTLLKLTELRFAQGLVSSVDVLQQREQLASLRQQRPAAELRLRQALNSAAASLGQTPPKSAQDTIAMPSLDEHLATLTPADLLQRRPDLLAQRAALSAADRRFEAALRAHLPDASISASALLQMVDGNPSAVLGAALDAAMTLFDSGRLSAAESERAALLQQAGVQYLQTWLQAVRETDDLLNQVQRSHEQLQLSQAASEAAAALFDATRSRYQRGIIDYLPVLDALQSLQRQQRDHLALQAEHQRVLVRLHTALGLPRAIKASEASS
jgi:outer membrane protein TolC